jgi:hypothetical protein
MFGIHVPLAYYPRSIRVPLAYPALTHPVAQDKDICERMLLLICMSSSIFQVHMGPMGARPDPGQSVQAD